MIGDYGTRVNNRRSKNRYRLVALLSGECVDERPALVSV
jgi:hypothetical protein